MLQEKQVALTRILRAEDLLLPNGLKIAVECRRGDPLGRGVTLGDGIDGENVGEEIGRAKRLTLALMEPSSP